MESTEKLHAAEDACDAKEIELRRCTDQQAKAEQKAASALRRVQELEFAGSRGDQDKLIKSREVDSSFFCKRMMCTNVTSNDGYTTINVKTCTCTFCDASFRFCD